MIDTVKLRTKENVPESLKNVIEAIGFERRGTDNRTGEISYQITNSELSGTYDSRVSLRIQAEKLIIEGSLHKYLYGNNVEVKDDLTIESIQKLLQNIKKNISEEISTDYNDYEVMRIDYAKNFKIREKQITSYIERLQGIYYPRRVSIHAPARGAT